MTVGSQVKSCFSSIKSAESTINLLKNKTNSNEAKDSFETAQNLLQEVKEDMRQQVIYLSIEEPQYK